MICYVFLHNILRDQNRKKCEKKKNNEMLKLNQYKSAASDHGPITELRVVLSF